MDKNGGQWANDVLSVNGVPADTQHGQQTNGCLYAVNNALAVQKKASFVSMDVDGFTVNFTNATSALQGQVISLALKGSTPRRAALLGRTSTSLPAYVQSTRLLRRRWPDVDGLQRGQRTWATCVVVSINFGNQATPVTSVTDTWATTPAAIGRQAGTPASGPTPTGLEHHGGAVITAHDHPERSRLQASRG